MDNGGEFTDRLVARAGIAKGASALDIGCGTGEVTLRLARAVGPEGAVTGLDLNAPALAQARARADAAGVTNTRFEAGDFLEVAKAGRRFDVVTCRRVLMYLPDQPAAVRAFRDLLNPGGLLLLQEHDATLRHPARERPLAVQAQRWIWETVAAEGANPGTGFELHALLAAAGFSEIEVCAEAVVETPSQAQETAGIVRAILPRIEAAGVAAAEEIGVETLAERLAAERAVSAGTSIAEMMFGAIARRG